MENVPLWLSITIAVVLLASYAIMFIINLLKLRKAIKEFKSTLSQMTDNKISQMESEEEMKKIFCDKCGKDITSATQRNYNGYDLCDRCFEEVNGMEGKIAEKQKAIDALNEQISIMRNELERLNRR